MTRILTLVLAAGLLATVAHAQERDLTAPAEGEVKVVLPDGTIEIVPIGSNAAVRILVRNGDVTIDQDPVARSRGDARVFVSRAPFMDREPDLDGIDVRLDTLFAGIPAEVQDRLLRLNLPRIRVEREVSNETRRALADVERDSRRLALRLRQAEREDAAADAERLRSELRETLEAAFDLHQQARQERLETLRERQARLADEAAALEAELQERQRDRDAIIDRRQRELLGERDGLDW